jgi:competence ComEA-like helix-hairpin-helix protein
MNNGTQKRFDSHPIRAAALLLGTLGVIAILSVTIARAAGRQDGDDHSATAFKRVCSSCHDAERILAARRTRTQWEEIIEKMIERGAEGTEDDFNAAEQYLLRVSGRVNVNRAVSADLVAVLGLTQKDADAIAEHRKAHGDFKDFDDLCKVPGIDLQKLKQGRDAVSF